MDGERFFVRLASADKGRHACGPDWNAVCCVIVLDLRQQAYVLCLADNAPDRPASPSEFFTEDRRRLARQTRQAGWRPPTRITTPDVVLPREKPCVPLSTDAKVRKTQEYWMSFQFSDRSYGGKDPLSAAGDGFRGSPIPNFLDSLSACQKGFLTR